ncbi:MAG TPA: hypothetical protein PLB63_11350 [Planctomycetota bacterium]|nr:hypothetical protein [Planctomycetota bacterium]HQB01530.1 hypothetical protein [Planctomycetota bacterium]
MDNAFFTLGRQIQIYSGELICSGEAMLLGEEFAWGEKICLGEKTLGKFFYIITCFCDSLF